MTIILMVFFLNLQKAQAKVVFDDGVTHTIDTFLNDSVEVRNSPLSQPTTLNLVKDGEIYYDLGVYDSSQANISGGVIVRNLVTYNSSQINMSDGSIGNEWYAYNDSQISISGGSISDTFLVYNSSQVSIYGGSISIALAGYDISQISISGGSIGMGLYAYNSSQVTINGSGFNHPLGNLTGSGYLTGIFPNGELINIGFFAYDTARIVLIPEPATLLLTCLGIPIVSGLKRKY
jgi:hypothetical protein